jgi:16S rRNA pseudouridine516 synthase
MTTGAMRLDRLLTNLGYGSRKQVQALARHGGISLDGAPVTSAEAKITLDADLPERLRVGGARLDPLPGMALMLHKPVGVTCSHREAGPLVYGLLPERWRRRDPAISSAGRLDKDTSGLLILTDDGDLLHKVISPKRRIEKAYIATLDRPMNGSEADLFASGAMMLHGEATPLLPARLEVVSDREAIVRIVEGRYHQVRRMFAATGNHVVRLHRLSIGALSLPDDLAPGAYAILDPGQKQDLLTEGGRAAVPDPAGQAKT